VDHAGSGSSAGADNFGAQGDGEGCEPGGGRNLVEAQFTPASSLSKSSKGKEEICRNLVE